MYPILCRVITGSGLPTPERTTAEKCTGTLEKHSERPLWVEVYVKNDDLAILVGEFCLNTDGRASSRTQAGAKSSEYICGRSDV